MSSEHPETNREFFEQFLDEYYAESEEHLVRARRDLLLLEDVLNDAARARPLLDELFRSFHTLKGISGMVGLTSAELLAHHLESHLRLLRNEQIQLTMSGIEALIAGTNTLEAIIVAHRNKDNTPNIDALVARLEYLSAEPMSSIPVSSKEQQNTLPENEISAISIPSDARFKKWRFSFTPSVELSEQGVNVNRIRADLQQIGDIVRSTPIVKSQGEICFEFVVTTAASEAEFAAWNFPNLDYAPLEDAEPMVEPFNPQASSTSAQSMLASAGLVRVDLARLDDLMRMIGEVVSTRASLAEQVKTLRQTLPPHQWRKLQETNFTIERQLRDLRDGVIRVRMLQVGEIFERMRFVIRDLARENGKEIKLELLGQQTEIDKFLIERLMDPMLHLVRNAVSHGLERPDERISRNKSPEGRLTLRAATIGERISIEIADDGRGIDAEKVAAHARAKNLIGENEAMDNRTLLEVLCTPGFSTRDTADRESGRGVGMDVVNKTVKELGGTLSLQSENHIGTSFTIEVPLTLAIADALIAVAGNQRFAVPQSAVREIIEVEPEAVKKLENNEIVSYRDGVLPLVRLARLFELEQMGDRAFQVLVIGSGATVLGIAVDRVLGQREIVVRGLEDPLLQVPGIAGATELGDQKVVLILDTGKIQELAVAGR